MTLLVLPDEVKVAMIGTLVICGADSFFNVVEVNISAILEVINRDLWMEFNVVLLSPISVLAQDGIYTF